MNLRKILTLSFISILSIGVLVGCGNTKKKELSRKEVKVNINNSKNNQDKKEKITEETSLEIAIDGFEKYFKEILKKEEFDAYLAHSSSKYETETFNVESKELVETDNDEYPKYRAEIDGITGEIKFLGHFSIKDAKDYNNFDVEKGKNIAIEFIKEHKLLDVDKIEFIDDLTAEEKEFYKKSPSYFYSFKAENGSLIIRIDKVDCEVGLFKFEQPIILEG